MEQYREKLKIQNGFLAVGCLAVVLYGVLALGSELGWFHLLSPVVDNPHWKSTWYGYLFGSSIGIFSTMLGYLIRNIRAMKHDKKLKELYVKEHDERTIRIRTLAGNTAMQCLLWMGLVATVIAGYFSITVSTTILACIFVCSAVNLILIAYYNKKI